MEKLLTIIIPTYNMEKYLDKCLSSLIVDDKELMTQLEVLVVIDGAKDRSSEIAHTYQDKYPDTYVVIDKENGNYGSCINRGLKEASGKYVKVLDADDYFETSNFQNYLSILGTLDVDLVITDFEYVNDQYTSTGSRNRIIKSGTKLYFKDVVNDFNNTLISMHELTYRTSIFKSLNYSQTEGISYTDLEWCFTPMIKVETIYYYDKIVYKYLIGREGQTISPDVATRTISHKIKSANNMLRQYTGLGSTDTVHDSYLIRRLTWSIDAIYYNFLVSYPNLDSSLLVEFDKDISHENREFYTKLSQSPINKSLKFMYIQNWRENQYKRSLKLKVVATLLSLYSKVRNNK